MHRSNMYSYTHTHVHMYVSACIYPMTFDLHVDIINNYYVHCTWMGVFLGTCYLGYTCISTKILDYLEAAN